MITQFKKADIKNILNLEKEENLYLLESAVSDKLRTLYVHQGWTHMTSEFHKANEVVEGLLNHALRALDDDKKEITAETAGLMISAYIDEMDYINIDCYFRLI